MTWLDALRSAFSERQTALSTSTREALHAWQSLPEPDLARPTPEVRWVVVDVESSGLDVNRDRLLAIGAVAIRSGGIDFSDSFEVVLKQPVASSDDNILVHGIGGTEQRSGVDPTDALLAFLDYVGKDPLVAFHAFFDDRMLSRSLRQHLGLEFDRTWLDLAELAPAVVTSPPTPRGLDDWLARFGIVVSERHRAVADAFATAQLFQVLDARAANTTLLSAARLLGMAKDYRWLADMRGGR